MLVVDMREVDGLSRDLQTFARKAVPFATREALSAAAFEGRKVWISEIGKSMTIRNTFTHRSLRVVKASGYHVRTMQAVLGSTVPYMATQERGGTETKRGKHGVPIPTNSAAGGSLNGRPRKRVVQKKNWLSALKVAKRTGGRRQQRNAAAIAIAAKSTGVAYLDLRKRRGLFRVMGTKRGLKIRMLWDLTHPFVQTPKNPTLQQTLAAVRPVMPELHKRAIIKQLRYHKVLGY